MTRYFRFSYSTKGSTGFYQLGCTDGKMPSEAEVFRLIQDTEAVDSNSYIMINSIFEFKSKEDFDNWARKK